MGINNVDFGVVTLNAKAYKDVILTNTGRFNYDFAWTRAKPQPQPWPPWHRLRASSWTTRGHVAEKKSVCTPLGIFCRMRFDWSPSPPPVPPRPLPPLQPPPLGARRAAVT